MSADIVFVALALWLAFVLRLSGWTWPSDIQIWLFVPAPIIALPVFMKFGLYREVVRYVGYRAMLAIIKATGIFVLMWTLLTITFLPLLFGSEATFPAYLDSASTFPRSIPIIFWMILILIVGGSRQIVRWTLFEFTTTKTPPKKNVLIYGAGKTGLELASSLYHDAKVNVLGFIDDDLSLKNHYIQSLKVFGDRTEIARIRENNSPLEVLFATPQMNNEERKKLLKYLEDKKVSVRTVPPLAEIASGEVAIGNLRGIDIKDLLAREVVAPNPRLLTTCISNKNVLVTGAGGSIGSELCRQIVHLEPACIVLFDHSELNLFSINSELLNLCERTNNRINIFPILGSVINKDRIYETIKNFKIDTIYHAAAYKHVALIEDNIDEGVSNNIFGTYNIAQAALDFNIENFILISTDKAVRPTSIMGATKRIAELIIQGLSNKATNECISGKSRTRFIIVRFGNVMGSSGSVIPLFQKQIENGSPVTITHPEATRYFMTISEASQLVIQAGSMSGDCSVFILNMGQPISILSLAKQMIYFSGHTLKTEENKADDSAIEIKYTGLRRGEKIKEELFISDNIKDTEHPMIMKAQEIFCEWQEVAEMLKALDLNNNLDSSKMRQLLFQYSLQSNFKGLT